MASREDGDLSSPDWHGLVKDRIRLSCEEYLRRECGRSSRSWILQRRIAANRLKLGSRAVMEFRILRVPTLAHRVVLTRLVCSDHDLAVEALRVTARRWSRKYHGSGDCVASVWQQWRQRLMHCWSARRAWPCQICVAVFQSDHKSVWQTLTGGGYHGEETLMVLVASAGLQSFSAVCL
ncbi:hypothetical protein BDZ89DRAFT_205153 [Hymenopellis radicata]|nr:hypothetical protein BDZ89DRAFT_205153 [Hymenopellis radicata]